MDLTQDELARYSRHLILPQVGVGGQRKIRGAKVLCIGAGGLGSPCIMYLAAAGVGTIGIVDSDQVELSNLQRQTIHSTHSLGSNKALSAQARVGELNPHVTIIPHPTRLTAENALDVLGPYDIVVDGSDNFATRYLANDACALLRKPCVYGAVFQFEGQASLLAPHLGGPCYRCMFPEPPPPGAAPSCAEAGVLGVVPGIVGLIQAAETLKYILGTGDGLLGRLLLLQISTMSFREIRIKKDPACQLCGANPTISTLQDYEAFCGALCSQKVPTMHPDEVTVQDLKQALENPSLGIRVLDVREPDEYQIAKIPGATLFPLSTLPQRASELDPNQAYYLHCKAGGRSMKALEFLRSKGFKNLKSVQGGITKWSEQIDPSVPKY